MNPKNFLVWGGIILVVVGILGFVGVIGPAPESSIFGSAWWFDNAENWAHLVLGIVALIVAYALPMSTHKPIVIIVGVVALLVGLWSLFIDTYFLGAMLQNPWDTLLHLVIGVWALWAGMKKQEGAMPMSPAM